MWTIHEPNGLERYKQGKAEAFTNSLELHFRENISSDEESEEEYGSETEIQYHSTQPDDMDLQADQQEAQNIIESLGWDMVTNECIRNAPINITEMITTLMNALLRKKNSIIILLQNQEKIQSFLSRLQNKLTALNTIPEEEYGFQPGHSCELQLTRVIRNGLNRRKSTGIIMFNISKAFGKV